MGALERVLGAVAERVLLPRRYSALVDPDPRTMGVDRKLSTEIRTLARSIAEAGQQGSESALGLAQGIEQIKGTHEDLAGALEDGLDVLKKRIKAGETGRWLPLAPNSRLGFFVTPPVDGGLYRVSIFGGEQLSEGDSNFRGFLWQREGFASRVSSMGQYTGTPSQPRLSSGLATHEILQKGYEIIIGAGDSESRRLVGYRKTSETNGWVPTKS